MIFRTITFLLILFVSCKTASKTVQKKILADDNKDVVVLSYLIKDYMRNTRNTNFTLEDIIKKDTSGRITKNFSGLEVGNWSDPWRGGYAVYFKFADGRNNNSVKLTQDERMPWKVTTKTKIGRNKTQLAQKFDGEIHFHFPERGYHINEIVLKKSL
ncbi:hypothetical protein LWM68_39930 [Niabella sp. W65]|nr:hypothetical protein [Niabella sp. W65]MCH7368366.1 hypothetical protein [Niabella sp. W65]ULT43964.1 hypothetical protein KRR40_11610 [Niabella sp. I65]